MRHLTTVGVLTLLILGGAFAEARAQTGNCEPALAEDNLDVNNVRARILNNGNLFWRGSPAVYEVPKGGGASAIFASGIWLAGQVNGELRAAASRYGPYEFWAGPLDESGSPPANCGDFDRIYKVSRNDVQAYNATGVATPDLQDWPTGLGAPTLAPMESDGIDNDDDGEVDEGGEMGLLDVMDEPLSARISRTIDLAAGERPQILGDQLLWWVMNDRGNQHLATNTPPIGLEVHASAFAFNTAGAIGNTTFYRYKIFYRGSAPLTDAYIGIFSDPDLGDFDDDYVGSDTTLGLGYVYNANNEDAAYGAPAPAAGYDFFQGPPGPLAWRHGRRPGRHPAGLQGPEDDRLRLLQQRRRRQRGPADGQRLLQLPPGAVEGRAADHRARRRSQRLEHPHRLHVPRRPRHRRGLERDQHRRAGDRERARRPPLRHGLGAVRDPAGLDAGGRLRHRLVTGVEQPELGGAAEG